MRQIFLIFLISFLQVMLTGCGSTTPSRFYLLTSVEAQQPGAATLQAPAVGIGPVTFPAYLDRSEIALRSGGNEIHYAGSHRWATSLKTAFSHTLSENLSILLPTDKTLVYPWSRSTRLDYQLMVNVTRFDAATDGTVVLAVSWNIIRSSDNAVIKRNRVSYTEAAGGTDYAVIVAAQSRVVEKLSRDIAATKMSVQY